jgi:hypothetical protein
VHNTVAELRGIGWQVPDELLTGEPEAPVAVTVPDLIGEAERRLPFGKDMRSRVSGWTTRTLAAKPIKKAPPAVRLAALFLAAHGSSQLHGQIPADLPEACRPMLPVLLDRGFHADLVGERYRLDPAVGHLSGRLGAVCDEAEQAPAGGGFRFSAEQWAGWKEQATPALRRHVEAVETCRVCALPAPRVAAAFMAPPRTFPVQRSAAAAYGAWKDAHPDRGPLAAEFTVAFRAEHGHGPSYNQLCRGLKWNLPDFLRSFVVQRLRANGWLTDTSPVPWTLRPGQAAHAQGIMLPAPKPVAAG